MLISDSHAPKLSELRAIRAPVGPGFPLYPDLVDLLVDATEHPNPDGNQRQIAHALATLSTYAYSDEQTLSEAAARLGLRGNRCRLAFTEVDVLFVRSAGFLIQSEDGRVVVLAYRGTSPTSAINWLADLDIDPEKVRLNLLGEPDDYRVHRGFYRNVRATGWEILQGLDRALAGYSVTADESGEFPAMPSAMQALYITGHSLGGAMASLAAILLSSEPEYAPIIEKLRAVYTYGGPMVCDPKLADRCDEDDLLGGRMVRYVYGHDAVPQLPPKASGDFQHFGVEYRHKADEEPGGWELSKATDQLSSLLPLGELVPSFLARQLTRLRGLPFHVSLADHLPAHYLSALAPDEVRTEFGD